ncbi:MAG: DivIVA domain-containing protein [Clostridia bacterium]|nr:DivIVA domain-containing protein [Clostridia bacterium]
MFTPQQVQEATFDKAVFGGYDMASVDEFLEPLTEDYISLYKENAVLKSKMRVLVEKLEEYRKQEGSMKNAIVAAQTTCNEMIAEAQRKSAKILNDAEQSAASKSVRNDEEIGAEQEKLKQAKAATTDFIEAVEAEIRRQLDCLNNLKLMNPVPESRPQPAASRAFDFDSDPQPVPQAAPAVDADQIASEIQSNLEKLVGSEPAVATDSLGDTKIMEPLRTPEKFNDLQFGRNYDPRRK